MEKRITIVTDRERGGGLVSRVHELAGAFRGAGAALTLIDASGGTIHFCRGCWTCWWKTPGRCVFADDMHRHHYASVTGADLLLFAAPLVLGFPSAAIKRFMDRMVPLIHPYFELVEGEMHHRKRYESYPDIALLLHREADTDDEDLEIVYDIFRRFALNFRTECVYAGTTESDPGEVVRETLRV